MTRYSLQLAYRVETVTQFHLGTGYGIAGVVDARTARTTAGAVYLPGSSLKGRVRYHLGFLAHESGYLHNESACRADTLCPLCNLLGNAAHETTLSFSDLYLSAESDVGLLLARKDRDQAIRPFFEVSRRTNVMISRRRGVAQERHLFTSEVGAAGLFFTGRVDGYVSDAGRQLTINAVTLPRDAALLAAALLSIEHVGGHKSRGLGRCRVTIGHMTIGGIAYTADMLLAALAGEAAT